MKKDKKFTFKGFEQSNTTPVPDVLFDELLSELSGAELKALLYIIRRTRGFKKDDDAISLSQFQHGITTKDGRQLDKGCGIRDRQTLVNALFSLEEKHCIVSEKTKTANGDNAITVYRIAFSSNAGSEVVGKSNQGSKENPTRVVGKSNRGSRKNPTRVVGKSNPQVTVVQETVGQQTDIQVVVGDSTANGSTFQKDKTTTTTENHLEDTLSFPVLTPEVEKLAISCARITGLPLDKDMQALIAEFADLPVEEVTRNMMDFVLGDPSRYASLELLRYSLKHKRDHLHDGKKEKTSRREKESPSATTYDPEALEKARLEAEEHNKAELEKLNERIRLSGSSNLARLRRQSQGARGVPWT